MSGINLQGNGVGDLQCRPTTLNEPRVESIGILPPGGRLCPTGRGTVSGATPTFTGEKRNPGNESIALFLSMLSSSQQKFWEIVNEQETEVGRMNDLQAALTALRNAQRGKAKDFAFDETARNAVLDTEITLADDSPLRAGGAKTATLGHILDAYEIGGGAHDFASLTALQTLTETLSTEVEARNRTSQLKMLKVNEWQSVVHEYSTFAAEQISKYIEAMTAAARKLA
ncbi:MAG: hypothetical protein ACRYG5_06200 [Janthinobacterium lividum]